MELLLWLRNITQPLRSSDHNSLAFPLEIPSILTFHEALSCIVLPAVVLCIINLSLSIFELYKYNDS